MWVKISSTAACTNTRGSYQGAHGVGTGPCGHARNGPTGVCAAYPNGLHVRGSEEAIDGEILHEDVVVEHFFQALQLGVGVEAHGQQLSPGFLQRVQRQRHITLRQAVAQRLQCGGHAQPEAALSGGGEGKPRKEHRRCTVRWDARLSGQGGPVQHT